MLTNSESKVKVSNRTGMRSLSKGSINISPQDFAMSIVNDRIVMYAVVS